MKKKLIKVLAATVIGCSVAPAAAFAQAVPPASIITINMDRVINESAAGKNAQVQLKAKLDAVQSRVTTLRDQFGKEEEALVKARQGNTMAQPAWEQKVKELNQRKATAETELRGREQDYSRSQGYVLQQINTAVNPIISQIMREKNANIALNEGATIQQVASLDVTNEVITRLNRALPTVSINAPAQTSQNAAPAKQNAAPAKAQ
jgi:outer membrane protein